MSLGTGRPIVLRDENTIRHCRLLLKHPMQSPTDVRLIALVELIAHKSKPTFSHSQRNACNSYFQPRFTIISPLSTDRSTQTL